MDYSPLGVRLAKHLHGDGSGKVGFRAEAVCDEKLGFEAVCGASIPR
jgi:hypothetical protein